MKWPSVWPAFVFSNHISDNAACSCGYASEDTEHFPFLTVVNSEIKESNNLQL